MADKQSREVITDEVTYRKDITEFKYFEGDPEIQPRESSEESDLTVKVDVDVSEALTGLKALQREAREATKALRELETYYESEGKRFYVKWLQDADDGCTDIREVCMSDIPTKYLHREIAKREGMTTVVVSDDWQEVVCDNITDAIKSGDGE